MKVTKSLTRRSILKAGLAGVIWSLIPSFVSASYASAPARSLSLYNTHTGETLKTVYWEKGFYVADSLKAVNHVLRDHRTGETKAIDTDLLDLLYVMHNRMESGRPFDIISGYRSPKSNTQLYEHTGGVAFKSLHMEGKAIDIRLADRSLKSVRAIAMQLQQGGVGYYPDSDFVHVDTGAVRYW